MNQPTAHDDPLLLLLIIIDTHFLINVVKLREIKEEEDIDVTLTHLITSPFE